jgi:hypothetical protein
MPTFADRGCHVVSVTDPYGRILNFLDRDCYIFFQVASQLYLRGRVDPRRFIYHNGRVEFSLLHSVQTGSGAHPASYTIGIGGFPEKKRM